MKKYILLLLACVFLLCGCGTASSWQETGKEEISVIAILKARNSLHWQFVMEGLEQTAKNSNVNLHVIWPEREVDTDTQLRMLQDAIQAAPDVIIWAPDDSSRAGEYAKQIKEAGIHLIYVDENASQQEDVPYVGSDNYHAGELAARSMGEALQEQGTVAFIGGSQEQQVHYLRGKGFTDSVEQWSNGECLVIQEVPDCSIAGGKAAMKQILQEHPQVQGVFCASALLCMGAQEACQSEDRTEIVLVGMDTQSDVLTALKNRKIHAVISQSGYEMGCRAMELAVKQTEGQEIPAMNYIKNEIISRENVKDYLDAFVMEGRE
ncbi:MAG: sugar ABC transporter substrate-binding protein [Lachnospiraceae bacterium]|nr:sugar ABC transporter substrate-binding protein [Lachnospiraceae bacterium]